MNESFNRTTEKGKKRGKILPALCNLLGTIILLTAIASCLPVTVPRLFGYEIYHVITGSMEPEIPVGSIIYVEKVVPRELQTDDIIAFHSRDSVITHRVVQNNSVEGEITTKGDANAGEDMNAVAYNDVIGRVAKHYPMLGALMELYSSTMGKLYLIAFAACGAMLNLLAGRLRSRRED